ncbi:hypothetical protein WDU94_002151 [Cyamophila willieti]
MLIPLSFIIATSLHYVNCNFTFPSRTDTSNTSSSSGGSQTINLGGIDPAVGDGRNFFNNNYDEGDGPPREGKHLFNWLDNVVPEQDPYIKKLNDGQPLRVFQMEGVVQSRIILQLRSYGLNENTRVIKIYRETSANQDSEFARSLPQTQEPEFDSFLQFLGRKMESFIKARAIEVNLPDEITDSGRYEPKAIFDDIYSEVDILEDKKDSFKKRNKLKKLIVPLLIVLKLFKLKLLLFLPLFLGLAGFKKILGFLAIIIPGVIGYFKFCKPHNEYGTFGHSNYYSSPHGPTYIKDGPHIPHIDLKEKYPLPGVWNTLDNLYGTDKNGYVANSGAAGYAPGYGGNGGAVSFKDADAAQSLAYGSYVKK